ncbi:MAG: protein kinase [Gemmataceae bacterium]
MQTSRELWDAVEHLRLLPTGEAARVKERWFRSDRAGVDDPAAFGRWLVTNGFVSRYAVDQIRAGQAERLRLGQYILLEPCPAGPHHGSYFAADTLGRKVLLDLVDEKLSADADLVRAFESAAERAMAVQHPHVNRVLDFGQAQNRLYLVRELDDGTNLAEVLQRRDHVDATQAARIFSQAFAGLQALHEKQVQGGDLTAESLLLATTGKKGRVIKVLRPGMPEALFAGSADASSLVPLLRPLSRPEDDVYRLGQAFYVALTGKQPATTLSGGGKLQPIRDLDPDVPELLADTVEQMVAAEPGERPRAAARVAKTLRVFLASEEEARTPRAEEEIAAVEAAPAPAPVEEEREEAPVARKAEPSSKLAQLWEEVKPGERDWLFLAAGSVGVIVLVLLVMLLTGIHFINIVCLLTGGALSFFAERLLIQRGGSSVEPE